MSDPAHFPSPPPCLPIVALSRGTSFAFYHLWSSCRCQSHPLWMHLKIFGTEHLLVELTNHIWTDFGAEGGNKKASPIIWQLIQLFFLNFVYFSTFVNYDQHALASFPEARAMIKHSTHALESTWIQVMWISPSDGESEGPCGHLRACQCLWVCRLYIAMLQLCMCPKQQTSKTYSSFTFPAVVSVCNSIIKG